MAYSFSGCSYPFSHFFSPPVDQVSEGVSLEAQTPVKYNHGFSDFDPYLFF